MKSLFQDQIVFSILIFSHVLFRAALEDQQEDTKKSDRFGMSWFETDNWLSDPLPPAPVGPPAQRPQVIRPPAPLDQARAPAPLDQGRPPAPLVKPPAPIQNFHQKGELESVTRGGVHAEDIHCIRSNGVTLLSAVVIPPPEYTSQPVFEDAVGPNYSPADCAMRPNEGSNGQPRRSSFAMHVQHFNKCGVRVQQGSDGKEWISVTLRFPYMDGLRMAEDEYVMIMCKPQDRIATTHHVMDIRPTSTEIRTSNKPRPVFRSGSRDVSCRMSLMTRGQGSRTFNKEMKTGSVVRVGQELQIRGQVREGDGWNYAMLKDVLIARVLNKNRGLDANNIDALENKVYRDPRPVEPAHDVAQLVFGDGCRNPLYRPVAPLHPQRDPKNPLMVSFAFRAFMFQDMLDGETLRISAQVVACADISDCQQVFCSSDGHRTLGRVKRSAEVNVSSAFDQHHHVQNFTEDFQLTVTLGGFSKTPIMSDNAEVDIKPTSIFADCKLILISVSSAALLFCLVTTASAAIAIGSKRKSVVSPSRDEERKLKHKSDCCKRRN